MKRKGMNCHTKLRENERVCAISKEYHARKRNNMILAYILVDKFKENLLLGQKLASLANYVNDYVVDNKADMLSVTGLHQIQCCDEDNPRSRTGGWCKNRWQVKSCEIDTAADMYEAFRQNVNFKNCVVVGENECYKTETL